MDIKTKYEPHQDVFVVKKGKCVKARITHIDACTRATEYHDHRISIYYHLDFQDPIQDEPYEEREVFISREELINSL